MDGRYSQSASSSSSSSEKLKSSTKYTNDDRISDLPVEILHHILSFLNMKHAVQTCVLSRRWRNLWASLPFLNFDKELVNSLNSKDDSTAFRDFVDQVLLFRDNNICIQRFHLDCPKTNHLGKWIFFAKKYNVQELSIGILYASNYQELHLLHGLFTCTSLKVLELNYRYSDFESTVPHKINLPVLQTLRIHGLSFTSSIDKLFYACPILESLTINECRSSFFHLNISSSKLRELVINQSGLSNVGDDLEYCDRAAVKVYAPNLLSFRCDDYLLMNYSLENLSSLVNANISLGNDNSLSAKRKEHYTKSMILLMRAIQNVTSLTLSASDAIFQNFISMNFLDLLSCFHEMKIFSETDAFEGTQFCNLRCLKFCAIKSTYLNWIPDLSWIKAMTCLLRVSPNIETVSLTGVMSDSTDIGDYEEAGLAFGNLKHLKFVEFKNANGGTGGVNEFKFLENLVKNVVALKKLVIVFLPMPLSFGSYGEHKFGEDNIHRERFSVELLTLPTASFSGVDLRISESNKHFVATYSFFL